MARYVLRSGVFCTPNHGPPQLLGTGTRIADAASALPGDVVCDALAFAPSPAMQALDQSALALILG